MNFYYQRADGTTGSIRETAWFCKEDDMVRHTLEWAFVSNQHYWCSTDWQILHKLALSHGFVLIDPCYIDK